MNRKTTTLFAVTVIVIAGGAFALNYFQTHQKLGAPGVKTRPLAGSQNVEVVLPEKVLNYDSVPVEVSEAETNTLPKDTSFGKRLYTCSDGFEISLNVVLMGSDRTSLHKPQFCLTGQGWCVNQAATVKTNLQIQQPHPYDLPVVELLVNKEKSPVSGIYVYYYVTDQALSAGTSGFERMWEMARDVLSTGTLQRWAYVSYFVTCRPGQEEMALERVKQFITAATPEFQLYPRANDTMLSSTR